MNENGFHGESGISDEELIELLRNQAAYEQNRERTLFLNAEKAYLLKVVHKQMKYLLDKCGACYDIDVQDFMLLGSGMVLFIITDVFMVRSEDMSVYTDVLNSVDSFEVVESNDNRIRIALGIYDVYTDFEDEYDVPPTDDGLPL